MSEATQKSTFTPPAGDFLLYDGECPVCSAYVAHARLRGASHDLKVLDARDHPALVAHYRAAGKEINDGMIIRLGSAEFYGAEAMALINTLSSSSSWVARLLLRPTENTLRCLYPVLVWLRRLLLKMLGRPLIS